MEWKLDDSRPIWMQLEEQLTRRILSGWYKAGEKLPTVRDLAAEAGVNPNTMQRALAALCIRKHSYHAARQQRTGGNGIRQR